MADVDSYPRILSLFSGIGGLDLGVHRALRGLGFNPRTICYVEGEAFCCAALAAQMEAGTLDAAPIWGDVRTFDGCPWRGAVDLVVGGFPCQDLSVAGKQRGLVAGERSALWFEFARIIREVDPRWVFVENVPQLRAEKNFVPFLVSLAEAGFDACWTTLRAADVGAPHRRERVFILAHAPSARWQAPRQRRDKYARAESEARSGAVAHADRTRLEGWGEPEPRSPNQLPAWPPSPEDDAEWQRIIAEFPWLAPALESDVRRVVDGVPAWLDAAMRHRTDRLRALGNAVVPAQAAQAFLALYKDYS